MGFHCSINAIYLKTPHFAIWEKKLGIAKGYNP